MSILKYFEETIGEKIKLIDEEKYLDKKIEKMQWLTESIKDTYTASIMTQDGGKLSYSCSPYLEDEIKKLSAFTNNEQLELRRHIITLLSREAIEKSIAQAQTNLDQHAELGYLIDLSFDMNLHTEEQEMSKRKLMQDIIDKYTLDGYPICYDTGYKRPSYSNNDQYVNIEALGDKRCPALVIRFVGYDLLQKVIEDLNNNGCDIITYCIHYNKR